MSYNYFPGHMMKAKRMMEENIKIIDLLIELLDARAPLSSGNPEIDKLCAGKGRMVLLNKADLANEKMNAAWIAYFKKKGIEAVALDSRGRKGMREIDAAVQVCCREKIEKNKKKGIINRPMRAMVAGIPNVGKSTFINSYAGKAVAKTGNKPGVTRGKQWIRMGKNLELLDTPGILWPKIDDEETGFNLALLGSMNDQVLNREEMVRKFLSETIAKEPEMLYNIYGLTPEMGLNEMLKEAALHRNALKKGGEPDTDKAVSFILDDFRSGRIGRITLEEPPEAP
ncbi:MAG: ribosome biogenesis GTPase YlqF [Lachnospiraceae bacterium]|nr:ribosome biogenesis GTPase YlqF [Lachnospiraceae bacterium]